MAKKLVTPEKPTGVRRLPAADQRRLDALMAKNNTGTMSDAERAELAALVRTVEALTLENAQRLAQSH